MSKYYSINIPTKTYLKKYIYSLHGQPVIMSDRSVFTLAVRAFLIKDFKTQYSINHKNIMLRTLTNKVVMLAPMSRMAQYGHSLDNNSILFLNRFFEAMFEKHLYIYVDSQSNIMDRKDAIEQFCFKYNIELETDITAEALKKTEYRLRKKFYNIHLQQNQYNRKSAKLFLMQEPELLPDTVLRTRNPKT